MLRGVGVVGADVSEDHVASIFRVKIISELGTSVVTSRNTYYFFALWFSLLDTANVPSPHILSTLKMEATRSSK
jgi:hypothetical protein